MKFNNLLGCLIATGLVLFFTTTTAQATSFAIYDADLSSTAYSPASSSGGSWTQVGSVGNGMNAYAVTNDLGLGKNAWNISDNTEASASLYYKTTLTSEQMSEAFTDGWQIDVSARMVDDFDDTAALFILFGNGTTRYSMLLDLDANDDLVVGLQTSSGNITFNLTQDGSGAAAYHNFSLVFVPVSTYVSFFFDGTLKTDTFQGEATSTFADTFMFGAGSTYGRGSVNYNYVELSSISDPGPIPEPTTMLLLGCGLLGLAGTRRRMKK